MPGLDEQLARLGRRGHRSLVAGTLRGPGRTVSGWAADGEPPDGDTLFEIGSITKAFTGVLLADMHLRGEVALDDVLSTYLPAPRPAWRHGEPTLLDLATHRTGLPNVPGRLGRAELAYVLGLRRRDPWADVTAQEHAELVADESPRRAPGGRVGYSSMAVGLLGDALAHRAGLPYEALLRERVLDPLEMASTRVTVPPEESARLIAGHSRRGHVRPPIEDLMPAAGSLRSSADDMLRFLGACLHPPENELGRALAFARGPGARVRGSMHVGLCWRVLRDRRGDRDVEHGAQRRRARVRSRGCLVVKPRRGRRSCPRARGGRR